MSPGGMVNGTIVPIPKGRWTNLMTSNNLGTITLNSIFGKMIDMNNENENLCTSGLQFSFNSGSSASLCTAMVQQAVSYLVHGGGGVMCMVCY